MADAPLLTSNDIALAEQGCQLAIAWHRAQSLSTFNDKQIDAYRTLIAKLDAACQHRNPYTSSDEMPLDWGDDPIYGPLPAETPPVTVAEVIAERRRQIEVEGWTAEHDDEHPTGTLGLAAAAYVLDACGKHSQRDLVQQIWPFDQEWWKPKDPRRNLLRAAALIIAEIERLDRLDGQREKE